jgi:hypothetical protein
MWKEWLARTLSPRRAAAADPVSWREQRARFTPLPELEGDGLHPGSDEFRGALDRVEAD